LLPNLEALIKLNTDPEFQEKIVPDEKNFVASSASVLAGYEEVIIENGEITRLGKGEWK
jgi:hypothetical protein